MTQSERRIALIHALISEGSPLATKIIPATEKQQDPDNA